MAHPADPQGLLTLKESIKRRLERTWKPEPPANSTLEQRASETKLSHGRASLVPTFANTNTGSQSERSVPLRAKHSVLQDQKSADEKNEEHLMQFYADAANIPDA